MICNFISNRFIHFDLKNNFLYRFKLRDWLKDSELDNMAFGAVSFCNDIAGHVPPCVLLAVINTYFDGWTSDVCFQKIGSACFLCNGCEGVD